MSVILCLLLTSAPLAAADPSPSDSPPTAAPHAPALPSAEVVPASPASPGQALERAVELYVRGEHDAAMRALAALHHRAETAGDVAPEIHAKALVYLGEIQFVAHNIPAAKATFRLLAESYPDATVNRYDHVAEAVWLLQSVRQAVLAERPPEPEPELPPRRKRKPMPAWAYLPFGVPQFGQKRHARGALYALLQVGLGAASVATYLRLKDQHAITDPPDDDLHQQQFRTLFYGVQVPTTAGFYVTWVASVADSGITWSKRQRSPPVVSLGPHPSGGVNASLHWRF